MFGRAPVYVMSYEYTGGSCKGLPIDARKAETQAGVQVEERGFVLRFISGEYAAKGYGSRAAFVL